MHHNGQVSLKFPVNIHCPKTMDAYQIISQTFSHGERLSSAHTCFPNQSFHLKKGKEGHRTKEGEDVERRNEVQRGYRDGEALVD